MWNIGACVIICNGRFSMNYNEWSSLKTGDRVKRFLEGVGTIIASCGIGYVVRFDNGKIMRISDGILHKISSCKKMGC